MIEIGEVAAEAKLVEEPRGSGTVRIPPTPDAFPVVLVANDQLVERGKIDLQRAARAQRFDRFNKHDVCRAGTEARKRRSRDNEEFSRFKMRRGLQLDRGEMRHGIVPAARHVLNLLQNKAV